MREEIVSAHERVEPQPPHSPATPRVAAQAPSTVEPMQSEPQQPRSWAQMASKQPSQTVLSMQSSKPLRSSMSSSGIQNFDDATKGIRSSIVPVSAAMNPR